jgi:Na+/melibiose symporter-like transporter
MIKTIGVYSDFLGRIILLFVPFAMENAIASNSPSTDVFTNDGLRYMATNYSYLLLILASIVFLFIGSIIGYFYPTPQNNLKAYPKPLKLLISVCGGILAFIYYIETKKDIAPIIIIWVACVSFVSPAIIHLVHAFIIKFFTKSMDLSDDDLKRISESLKQENEENKP